MISQKEDQKVKQEEESGVSDYIEGNPQNFEKEVLNMNNAAVVYFTTLNVGADVTTEYKHFK